MRVVSLDVDIDTMAPKLDLLESLVSDKTVALLLAHIYGKWFDTRPFVETARKHNIKVICETWCLLILTCYRIRLRGQWVYNKLG